MEILITIILILSILIIFSTKKAERFLYSHILPFLTKIKISDKYNNHNYSKFSPNPDLDVLRNLLFLLLLREHHFLQRCVTGKSACACNQINNEHCMCRKAQRLWKDKVCKLLC
ncbi:MAG: hypothetical protein WC984_10455 [Bacteroidales bacterium]